MWGLRSKEYGITVGVVHEGTSCEKHVFFSCRVFNWMTAAYIAGSRCGHPWVVLLYHSAFLVRCLEQFLQQWDRLKVIASPDLFQFETILIPSLVAWFGTPRDRFRSFAFFVRPSVSSLNSVFGGSGLVFASLLVMLGTGSSIWKTVLPCQCSFDRWFRSFLWLQFTSSVTSTFPFPKSLWVTRAPFKRFIGTGQSERSGVKWWRIVFRKWISRSQSSVGSQGVHVVIQPLYTCIMLSAVWNTCRSDIQQCPMLSMFIHSCLEANGNEKSDPNIVQKPWKKIRATQLHT